MRKALKITASVLITCIHAFAFYYFYAANWVTNSYFLIVWVSFIQMGVSMSLLFYLGLVNKFQFNWEYFEAKDWEHKGKVYLQLGIKGYKFLLFHSPFVFLNKGLKLKKINKSQLQDLEQKMREVEFGHLIGAIIILIIIPLMMLRDWKFCLWLLIFNVLFHVYPIFLQRYNRFRIKSIIGQ